MSKRIVNPEEELPVTEHIEELRQRIFKSVIALIVGFLVAWPFKKDILLFLERPLPENLKGKLIFLSPPEAFFTALKVSFFAGILIALPFVLYQVWKFIEPGLYEHEKKFIVPFIFFSLLFFFTGASFAYFVILPFGLKFLLGFMDDILTPQITVGSYISFVIQLILAFGFVFLLPVVVWLLSKLGIINYKMLEKNRKYAILIIFVVAAVLTPPDIFSQIMMALPLLGLYELSIWIAKITGREE
ncbi:Sec-independent protein translocase, TatC subunit [Desulfurobacterium thermolithotrophum DSM 11699]|uniref:Sec-independent protein translocase protein TatC n=1 Tax=Desulfurobacterium thermolithotrophum (strain DSM 11699 / BSA) TaxID=868864 RepID=F0S405_DESTD|nr:twin-arginine translocase subunit TatC [Desulfurobacterium thermolithotrophum]ADY73577.1 Sec-independent protein translocase, TatC subunit [Desulfurobacterium thermolithotrophum DSM 11699]